MVGIIETERVCRPAVQILFLQLLYPGTSLRQTSSYQQMTFRPRFFARAVPLPERRVSMVLCAEIFERRVPIILRMYFRVVPAPEVRIVFLLAVIRKRLTGDLPPGDPAAIRERCDEQSIDRPELLHIIKNRLNTFIQEGDGSHLDADHLLAGNRTSVDPTA